MFLGCSRECARGGVSVWKAGTQTARPGIERAFPARHTAIMGLLIFRGPVDTRHKESGNFQGLYGVIFWPGALVVVAIREDAGQEMVGNQWEERSMDG